MCRTSPGILKLCSGLAGAEAGISSNLVFALLPQYSQDTSQIATIAPPVLLLHPDTSIFGSVGEKASDAGHHQLRTKPLDCEDLIWEKQHSPT